MVDRPWGIPWCLVTVLIYVGGYALVSVEGRYIVPVAAPLLCLAAMLFLTAVAPRGTPRRVAHRGQRGCFPQPTRGRPYS